MNHSCRSICSHTGSPDYHRHCTSAWRWPKSPFLPTRLNDCCSFIKKNYFRSSVKNTVCSFSLCFPGALLMNRCQSWVLVLSVWSQLLTPLKVFPTRKQCLIPVPLVHSSASAHLNLSTSRDQCPIFEPGDACREWTFPRHTLEENSLSFSDCLVLGTEENILQTWNTPYKYRNGHYVYYYFINISLEYLYSTWTHPVGMRLPSWTGRVSRGGKSSVGASRWRHRHASYCRAPWEARGNHHAASSMVSAGRACTHERGELHSLRNEPCTAYVSDKQVQNLTEGFQHIEKDIVVTVSKATQTGNISTNNDQNN